MSYGSLDSMKLKFKGGTTKGSVTNSVKEALADDAAKKEEVKKSLSSSIEKTIQKPTERKSLTKEVSPKEIPTRLEPILSLMDHKAKQVRLSSDTTTGIRGILEDLKQIRKQDKSIPARSKDQLQDSHIIEYALQAFIIKFSEMDESRVDEHSFNYDYELRDFIYEVMGVHGKSH